MHFYATKETQDLGTWAVVTSCFLGDYMVHLAQFQEVVAIFFYREPYASCRHSNGNPGTL